MSEWQRVTKKREQLASQQAAVMSGEGKGREEEKKKKKKIPTVRKRAPQNSRDDIRKPRRALFPSFSRAHGKTASVREVLRSRVAFTSSADSTSVSPQSFSPLSARLLFGGLSTRARARTHADCSRLLPLERRL